MRRRTTGQDISWFLDLSDRGQINLDPPYQRRSVWTRKDRLFFLDTIFKKYPCPAVFLHKETDENGKAIYHVVDGKQRLETVINFSENRMTLPRDHENPDFAGKKFKDLGHAIKTEFWDYVFGVEMLDTVEQSVIDEVFDRLNRNSSKLERQELRHAKYDGWFISFAEERALEDVWFNIGISTRARTKRMKDVQFISELMLVLLMDGVRGFSQDELDNVYASYEAPEDPVSEMPDLVKEDFEENFSSVIKYIEDVNNVNGCVTEYARTYMHFYTLWGYVALEESKLEPSRMAEKYVEFMGEYSSITKDQISEVEDDAVTDEVMRYAKNSVGANTDLPQRTARLEALKQFVNQ